MIFYKHNQSYIWIALIAGVLAFIAWGELDFSNLTTGETLTTEQYPHRQLAYTKLNYQGGNFTGDIYVLDIDTGETTQLTEGGITNSVAWVDPTTLLFYERPSGSVIISRVLDVNTAKTNRDKPAYGSGVQYPSPDNTRYVTHLMNDNNEPMGHAIVGMNDVDAQTLISIPDARSFPRWLRDSEAVIYQTTTNVCIHHIETDTRDCVNAIDYDFFPMVDPAPIAYVTRDATGFALCVASIEDYQFESAKCHDEHHAQFTGLAWRP